MFFEIAGGIALLVFGKKLYDKNERDNQRRLKAVEVERRSKLLEGVSVTVYVRESNGSRTDLEHHVEQEMISRGARALLANQENAMALVRRGEYSSLNLEAHLALVGTLVVRDGGSRQQKVYTEDEHNFNLRKALWRKKWEYWNLYHRSSSLGNPEPQLEERKHKFEPSACFLYQFSYRVLGRDGTILASGSEEELPLKCQPSFDKELRLLAKRAVETLDEKDVWPEIVI